METSIGIAVSLGALAAVGWGISGFFDAKASKTVGPIVAALLVNCIVTIGYCCIFMLFLRSHYTVALAGVGYAIASGAIITIGALSYFKGLSIGPVSLVSPMSSSYPLVTTCLALTLFHASLSTSQLFGLGLIILGVMIATNLIRPHQLIALESRGPLLGLLAALCWGIGYTLLAQSIQRLGWQTASLFELISMALAFGICVPLVKGKQPVSWAAIKAGLHNANVLRAGSIALCAALAFNIGLSHDSASGAIVAAISACYPILTIILALRHFDETVATLPLIGAVASVSGVIIIFIG